MAADLISTVEDAIITRLRSGLGKLVTEVASYAGEMDDNLAEVVRRMPACWVTFGGISKTEPHGTSRERQKAHGLFVVMVGAHSPRGASAARCGQGGVGTNRLVMAVRKLLARQDLGLPIDYLQPGKVRTLYNTALEGGPAVQVFACEFETAWIETALPAGEWPQAADPLFAGAAATSTPPAPDLKTVGVNLHLIPDDGRADATDIVTTQKG